jgi:hypothetical protein
MKVTSLKEIRETLKGIDNNIPRFLKEFYQSTLVNEITTQTLRKYERIIKALKEESIYEKADKEFMELMESFIGPWDSDNQTIYYEIIHARAVYFKRPIVHSRDYYAFILQYMK